MKNLKEKEYAARITDHFRELLIQIFPADVKIILEHMTTKQLATADMKLIIQVVTSNLLSIIKMILL